MLDFGCIFLHYGKSYAIHGSVCGAYSPETTSGVNKRYEILEVAKQKKDGLLKRISEYDLFAWIQV